MCPVSPVQLIVVILIGLEIQIALVVSVTMAFHPTEKLCVILGIVVEIVLLQTHVKAKPGRMMHVLRVAKHVPNINFVLEMVALIVI